MKVLVVSDEPEFDALVGRALRRARFTVLIARNGAGALTQAQAERPSVIVLDAALPVVHGEDVCRMLRTQTGAPVLLVATGPESTGAEGGPECRADDRLSRPIEPQELVARVRALVRRSQRAAHRRGVFRLGRLTLDRRQRTVQIDGRQIRLRAKEFELLRAFVEHQGTPLRRERLLQDVWGYGASVKTRTLDVHVNHLRRKLAGSGLAIETLRGVGYELVERLD